MKFPPQNREMANNIDGIFTTSDDIGYVQQKTLTELYPLIFVLTFSLVHYPEDKKYTIKPLNVTHLAGRDPVTGRVVSI